MQFINSINKLQNKHQHAVVTIGNFDGVHLGHQHLISILKEKALAYRKPSMVITFEPLPIEYFSPENAPARLTPLREKLLLFKELGIDYVLCLRFNESLANLSAKHFIDDILVKRLKITHLTVGEDFRFGQNREGDIALLEAESQQKEFTFDVAQKIMQKNERISSTQIRSALALNHFDLAHQLLGRTYTLSGRVIQGQKLGKTIGFPTANISLHNLTPPIQGVFAVKVLGLGTISLFGIANIGQRPTINGTKKLLEVHLFNFNKSIYGQHMRVIPLKKIRDEKKFGDLSELSSQIAKDILIAKEFIFTQHALGNQKS